MENQKRSRLYQALLCRDPVVRKQLVDNVMKLPEYEYNKAEHANQPVMWMFLWADTPEGVPYWDDICTQYGKDSKYWAEHPILDDYTLPQEYYITSPDGEDDTTARLLDMIDDSDGPWAGGASYYTCDYGRMEAWDSISEFRKQVPEIPYDVWVLAVENQYGKKKQEPHKYKAGDWMEEPWSIVTTDGVRVYLGSPMWWLSKDGTKHLSSRGGHGDGDKWARERNQKNGYLPFSTYEAAEEYRKKQCGEKQIYPEYKVGQTVLVHSGANVGGYDGKEGKVAEIDKKHSCQPHITVKFPHNGNKIHCYPYGATKFNVEILQEPSVVEQCMKPLVKEEESLWKVGDVFQIGSGGSICTVDRIENGYVVLKNETPWATIEAANRYKKQGIWTPYNPQPVPVTKDNAYIGMKVVRGRDWEWDDDDGGTSKDTVGVVTRLRNDHMTDDKDGWMWVKWPTNSGENTYRIGAGEKYDLYIAETVTKEPVRISTGIWEQLKESPKPVYNPTTNNNQNTNNQKTTNNGNNNQQQQQEDSNYKINKEVYPEHPGSTSKNVQPAIYIRSNPEVVDGYDYYGGKVTAATCKVQPTVS